MDLQLCLPIAVKNQLTHLFHMKKVGCISHQDVVAQLIGCSIMPYDRCEVERCRLPNRYGGIQCGLYRVVCIERQRI